MNQDTYHTVQTQYGNIAKDTCNPTTRQDTDDKIAQAFGYSAADLSSLPEKTNLGVSCGNPTAFASIKSGETIVDLGSGGGIDVLLAARKVGDQGRAIGVDMTEDMINLARRNAKSAGLANAEFIKSTISSIPLAESSVDCIISNCVVNLVPKEDKPAVFTEMARLLKAGGRVAISDILARKQLPQDILDDMALYVGCVSGASLVPEYEEWLTRAGFTDVLIVDTKADINVYKEGCGDSGEGNCCGSGKGSGRLPAAKFADVDFNEWVGSFQIYAVKAGQ